MRRHFHIQQTRLDIAPEQAWLLLKDPHTFSRLAPPWLSVKCEPVPKSIEEGSTFSLRIRNGVLRGSWQAKVTSLRRGFLIGFELLSPRARKWVIWTKLLPTDSPHSCILEERIEFADSALLGKTKSRLEKSIRRVVYHRHRTLKSDLQVLLPPQHIPSQRILIAGGTGLVGRNLIPLLRSRGHKVFLLSTRESERPATLFWDPSSGRIDSTALEGMDTVINLAGSTIATRWTRKARKRILDSRTQSTHLLVKHLLRLDQPPRQLIQASAVGFYGFHQALGVTEEGTRGEGFLAEVCEQWEAELKPLKGSAIQTSIARLGVVLTPEAGALAKMLPAFRLGIAGRLGNGKQPFAWISIHDLVRALAFLVEKPELTGIFNLCTPQAPNNATFTKELARTLRRPAVLPVPGLTLKLLYGTMANEALLGGIGAEPAALCNAGFRFEDASLDEALPLLLGRS